VTAIAIGITQSNISTPRATASSMSSGVPTPINCSVSLKSRLLADHIAACDTARRSYESEIQGVPLGETARS
jgi:hypothetical protein